MEKIFPKKFSRMFFFNPVVWKKKNKKNKKKKKQAALLFFEFVSLRSALKNCGDRVDIVNIFVNQLAVFLGKEGMNPHHKHCIVSFPRSLRRWAPTIVINGIVPSIIGRKKMGNWG